MSTDTRKADRSKPLPVVPPSDALENRSLLAAPEQVLATLAQDGTRRWIRPRLSRGRFLVARRVVAYVLMAIFVAIPWIQVGGKPLVLLDLLHRQFTVFGTTFRPTDTPLFMLLMLGIFVTVFLITALFGRAWCGWACPQTVYMEFLFRPLERLFEGSPQQQVKLDKEGPNVRRVLKNITFVLISAFLAHTFLAYFVGWEQLRSWITGSPLEHPTAFLVMGGVTAAMVLDFVWFREQTCLVACPYGRFQSVLLDRNSLIVGYDATRGEPRGKPRKAKGGVAADEPKLGDCIDCGACVITCPTGIDIRNGLQMECIGCTQCIDACDAIMDRVGRPRGLIRYTSQAELAQEPTRRILRPRVIAYSLVLVLISGLLLFGLGHRGATKVFALRGLGAPFAVLPTGEINNQFRIKVENLSDAPRTYRLAAPELPDGALIAPEFPLEVAAESARTTTVFVKLPPEAFEGGRRELTLRVTDQAGDGPAEEPQELRYTLLGPKEYVR